MRLSATHSSTLYATNKFSVMELRHAPARYSWAKKKYTELKVSGTHRKVYYKVLAWIQGIRKKVSILKTAKWML